MGASQVESVTISERFATTEKRNPISGHVWPEQGRQTGWEVRGGGLMPSHHATKAGAEAEAKLRESFGNTFDFPIYRSAREIRKARTLGLINV